MATAAPKPTTESSTDLTTKAVVARNILNVTELETDLEERLANLDSEMDAESKTQIETWVRTTFRKHAIRDSAIDYFSFHAKHKPIIEALHVMLPQILGCALADLEERHLKPWKGITSRGQRQLIAKVLPHLCAEFDPIDGAIFVSGDEYPSWANEDQIYGNVNNHNLLLDLEDLLDVMTSEWFKRYLPSLPKMSRTQVHESHEKWVKWLAEQATLNEDPSTLIKLWEFGDNLVLVELTTEANLKREGALAKHCLAGDGYAAKLNSKKFRYFSVRHTADQADEASVLTIELATKHNLITQVRGLRNRKPTLAEMKMLRPFFDSLDAIPSGVPFDVETKSGKIVQAAIADEEDDGDEWDDEEEVDEEEVDEEEEVEEEERLRRQDEVEARAQVAAPVAEWPWLTR